MSRCVAAGRRTPLAWVLSMATIFPMQDPHPVPASERLTTSLTVHAPSAMHPRTSASVTARQMQTYMAPAPLYRRWLGKAKQNRSSG